METEDPRPADADVHSPNPKAKKKTARFLKAGGVTNLLRDQTTGIYHARVIKDKKEYWQTLDTDVLNVAKNRLRAFQDDLRARKMAKHGSMTFGQVVGIYAEKVSRLALADSTKEFRLRPASTFKRTWQDLWDTDVRRISEQDCVDWLESFKSGGLGYLPHNAKEVRVPGNSPTVINACIAYLKRVFNIAIAEGLRSDNPALGLKRKRPRKKLMDLPSKAQFHAIVAKVRGSHSRWADASADLIDGLAYSGMRLQEAATMVWADINFDDRYMIIRGTKTEGSSRRIPLFSDFRRLLLRMKKNGEILDRNSSKIFKAESALTSLKNAGAADGVKKLTHHDLRHMFATTAIEGGVDIKVLAEWLGHFGWGNSRPVSVWSCAAPS